MLSDTDGGTEWRNVARAVCGAGVSDTQRGVARGARRRLEESLIVVTGLPRSGTSMLMQMLAAGGVGGDDGWIARTG